ncbi:hypothetical protein GCM10009853_057930 [Glycomyces scopariae]|uniref:Uncharacterized protein n=1 Tax=Glycomyces sambucus TaxID=380244 RepID=A0A1G9GM91_9ACTN|nr:hypothetical protein [Glycomyces sambucus]SDL01798.1 hypothetical protein SAMN05216298_2295 [Glycomyces sambucus]
MSDEQPAYEGPPVNVPPPPGWRVEAVALTGPPRRLPPQDHAAIDAAEQRARLVTQWLTLVSVALMFAVLIIGLVEF